MANMQTELYRQAFSQYIRKGTPISLSMKWAQTSQQYIWRTRRDAKVRLSHRMNDGRLFSWDNAPESGHPGEDYNCRCEAVPYIAGQTEYAYHNIITDLFSPNKRWSNIDFVRHYYKGGGKTVPLHEIGHLREIVEHFSFTTGVEGGFRRLSDQIADDARIDNISPAYYHFEKGYQFEEVQFSHWKADVTGDFKGAVTQIGEMLKIRRETEFKFHDWFHDPLDTERFLRHAIEPGGTPYEIIGSWKASFVAEVKFDKINSQYFKRY